MTDTTQPPAETRDRLTHDEQMQDAQKGCAPCALCGGHAIISDAGSGAGYFIRCSNSQIFKASEGCMIEQRRLGGWAYNVMDWWNRLHTAALTRRAGGDAGTVATIADLQRRRASDLDAVVNLSLCLKEARDALEWYRDTVGRCRMMHAEGDEARNALHKDCGERAEKALAFRVPAREPKHDQ